LATPIGALSGKSTQVILPAVVSIIAVGGSEVPAAGFFGAVFAWGVEVCDTSCNEEKIIRIVSSLRIVAPGNRAGMKKQK
jgi:hypothetical protein